MRGDTKVWWVQARRRPRFLPGGRARQMCPFGECFIECQFFPQCSETAVSTWLQEPPAASRIKDRSVFEEGGCISGVQLLCCGWKLQSTRWKATWWTNWLGRQNSLIPINYHLAFIYWTTLTTWLERQKSSPDSGDHLASSIANHHLPSPQKQLQYAFCQNIGSKQSGDMQYCMERKKLLWKFSLETSP